MGSQNNQEKLHQDFKALPIFSALLDLILRGVREGSDKAHLVLLLGGGCEKWPMHSPVVKAHA